MEAIRELVERTLEKKRILAQMKAELRAQVFLAIEEEETSSGFEGLAAKTRNPQRDSLLSSEEGKLLVALVREFLEWAGLEFTAKVFEPEMGPAAQYHGRMGLSKQLGMSVDVASQAPLLLKVLRQYQTSGASGALSKPANTTQQAPHLAPRPGPQQASAPAPASVAPPPAPSAAAAASEKDAEQSYDENFEIESDEGLEGAEIIADDEEEDYSAVVAKGSAPQPSQPASDPPHQHPPSSHTPEANSSTGKDAAQPGQEGGQAKGGRAEGLEDLSASSLSTSGFMAGRIRRPRPQGQNTPGSSGGHFEQSDDLLNDSNDRSANISHELEGYAPTPSQQPHTKRHVNAGWSSGHDDERGGLSFSGELPPHPDEEQQGSGDLSHSGGRSLDEHHPSTQRPPAPLGKLSPLGPPPLAPLGSNKLGPLSGPAPAHAPRVLSPPSKQGDALKEELYRAGLLPVRTKSQPGASQEDEEGEQASGQGSSHHSSGAVSGGGSSAAASSRRSSVEEEEEEEVQQRRQRQRQLSEGEPRAPESPEPSSGHSSNQNPSSRHSSKRSTGLNKHQGYDESKAVSMDLKDTGLSASDQSGDLETGALPLMGLDMEETAEWGS
uniref:FGFR1 oncogene partner (FOP) N-terminal dimerisation domain-containing protein n=1 Tax=Dunaliella tertiolecta TaxID=3047 RepID=A0A7S3QQQ7_DUNTE